MNQIEYTRMYEAEDRHWWYSGLHKLILATVQQESQRLGRPLKIFDAGCGTGRLCQLLTMDGHHVSGCDLSEEALRLCRLRGIRSVYQADLNDLELEPEGYDVITSIDVLYHRAVVDDGAVLRRLRNGLKPGGMLILNLVAHEFLRSTHDIAVHTRERYTKRTLDRRLHSAGFNSIFAGYRVCLLFPFVAVYRLMARYFNRNKAITGDVDSDVFIPFSLVNSLLLKVLEVENMFSRYCALPFGSSIFAVARK